MVLLHVLTYVCTCQLLFLLCLIQQRANEEISENASWLSQKSLSEGPVSSQMSAKPFSFTKLGHFLHMWTCNVEGKVRVVGARGGEPAQNDFTKRCWNTAALNGLLVVGKSHTAELISVCVRHRFLQEPAPGSSVLLPW